MNKSIITKKENWFLTFFALITFIILVAGFISFQIGEFNRNVEKEQFDLNLIADHGSTFAVDAGIDHRASSRVKLLFFGFFILIIIKFSKRYFISTLLSSISFSIIIYWLYRTNRDIALNESYLSGTPHLLKIASYLDYLAFISISILLVWQISILLRMLIKKFNLKEILP